MAAPISILAIVCPHHGELSSFNANVEALTRSEGLFTRKCVKNPQRTEDVHEFVYDCLGCDIKFEKISNGLQAIFLDYYPDAIVLL